MSTTSALDGTGDTASSRNMGQKLCKRGHLQMVRLESLDVLLNISERNLRQCYRQGCTWRPVEKRLREHERAGHCGLALCCYVDNVMKAENLLYSTLGRLRDDKHCQSNAQMLRGWVYVLLEGSAPVMEDVIVLE